MPSTEYQSSFSFGRSILRRDQVHSMEAATSQEQELELESFQRHVTDRLNALASAPPETLLSLSWVRKLLDAFLCCQEEFRMILFNNKHITGTPPMDRLMSEYFERTVKALDVCNAVRDGIEQIRQWEKQLEIVLSALDAKENRNLGEGQFRRAKKALIDLAICMLDKKDSNSTVAQRNRSFGRANVHRESKNLSHHRSLSWSVSRTWSASKQIQAIGNLSVPKTNEIMATNGLAVVVFTMSSVLYFVMWVLVAAIPCQDRGLHSHFNIPRQFVWANPIQSTHDKVLEESKKRDRRNSCGLMREIHRIEVCARVMNELTDSVQLPMTEEREREVRERVDELREVFEAVNEGLDPLESGVREVFHRIVRSRTDGLDSFKRQE